MDPSISYRHLDSKLRLGELSLGQWATVVSGVLVAIGYALYLHPFGAYLTLATAVYLAGLPALLALVAALYEVRLGLVARSIFSHLRNEGRFLPGAGEDSPGYVLLAVQEERPPEESVAAGGFKTGTLWER